MKSKFDKEKGAPIKKSSSGDNNTTSKKASSKDDLNDDEDTDNYDIEEKPAKRGSTSAKREKLMMMT